MRMLVVVAVLGACAPRFDRTAHTGRDGQASGARLLRLDDDYFVRTRGIVTARGGDSVDWVAFDVPRMSSCSLSRITVNLKWRSPRPDLHLALAMYDATGGRQWRATPVAPHAAAVTVEDLPPGRYLAKIFAPGRDDAGQYEIDVQAAGSGSCEDNDTLIATSEFYLARPAGQAAPSLSPAPGHVISDVRAYSLDQHMFAVVELAAGSRQGIGEGWVGSLVDDTGAPVRRGEVIVVKVREDRSVAALFDDVELARDPKPLGGAWTVIYGTLNGSSVVEIDRGIADGVAPDSLVQLVAPGHAAPLGEASIVWIDVHRALGLTSHPLPSVATPVHAIVTTP